MPFKILFSLFVLISLFSSCSKETNVSGTPQNTGVNDLSWTIPRDEVFDGGPGKDGIPSIDNPQFSAVSEVTFLEEDDLVIGVKAGDEIKAYPHPVLDWHEIVNDNVGGDLNIALTYCPLTGTAIGWNREVDGSVTTFGVSGLLYNSNLIPYDRQTDSHWSQMRLDCVQGKLQGEEIETYPVVETTWSTWKQLFPNSQVLNTSTGFNRSYGIYPYGDYKTSNRTIFPVQPEDDRLHAKERVLGVIQNAEAKLYRFSAFGGKQVDVLQDEFNGESLVIFGSESENFIVAYKSTLEDGTALTFDAIQEEGAIVAVDNEGTKWSVFGEAASGPRAGEQLLPTDSYIGYFFSWGAFYPNAEIVE